MTLIALRWDLVMEHELPERLNVPEAGVRQLVYSMSNFQMASVGHCEWFLDSSDRHMTHSLEHHILLTPGHFPPNELLAQFYIPYGLRGAVESPPRLVVEPRYWRPSGEVEGGSKSQKYQDRHGRAVGTRKLGLEDASSVWNRHEAHSCLGYRSYMSIKYNK